MGESQNEALVADVERINTHETKELADGGGQQRADQGYVRERW